MIRSQKLTKAANGESCTWPGCSRNDGTTVAAHSNMSLHGRGSSLRAHDCFIAFLCGPHHYEYDYGKNMDRMEKEWHFMRAMSLTWLRLIDKGLIRL